MSEKTSTTGTVEEYLEAILNIVSEGKRVLGARLAERLNVSPPTVTATLKRMIRDGLVSSGRKEGVLLTEKGMKLAVGVVRRHRISEVFLTDILKIPWHETHQEACLFEHAISEKVMNRLYEVLGKPATCPHGNPIPTDNFLPSIHGVPLNTIDTGTTVVVERISEEANRQLDLMRYFKQTGIKPGATIMVKQVADYAGTILLSVGKKSISLSLKAAAMVWVIKSDNF